MPSGGEGIRRPRAPPGLLLWTETASCLRFCGDVAAGDGEGHTVASAHNTSFQVDFQIIRDKELGEKDRITCVTASLQNKKRCL